MLLLPAVLRTVQEAVKNKLTTRELQLLAGIREATKQETEKAMSKHTKALGNQILTLLLSTGKGSHTAVQLCLILLEYELDDKERVKEYHEEAQIAAGKKYSRRGLRDGGERVAGRGKAHTDWV